MKKTVKILEGLVRSLQD